MARFYPIYVRRSDGRVEVLGKGRRKELNQPTDDQMDQKPDKNGVSDFYREVAQDEVKNLDWRRKLGGMLARELDWKDKGGAEPGCMLVAFPENYRLFEHVKKSEKDGKTEVKSKTHAAGGNDRQDAYLYGHPFGRRKRYRSPADFFPHLLWLCTDESGDPDNCSCKICCPEELENLVPGAKPVKAEKSVKQEQDPRQSVVPARQTSSQLPSKTGIEEVKPKASQRSNPTTTSIAPTPLPFRRTLDQQIDSQAKGFKYRSGELCWFRRGQAWGLGVVLRRWFSQASHNYKVQPLSHPFQEQTPVVKSSDNDMRPWLAWSVPKFTYSGLNDLPEPPRYETADWHGMTQNRFGSGGDLEVDGSILAAKSVDSSYTPFSPSKTTEPETGVTDTSYEGIYLGAEKIWVGEPVRLAVGSSTDILVVHSIVERTRTAAMTQQILGQSIHFIGDVYTLTPVAHPNPAIPTPASPHNNPHLPQRLTEDLVYRNARSIQTRQVANHWKLVSSQTRVDINGIKGRWYEASVWMPILQPDTFAAMDSKGDIQELSLYMNARGDCLQANRDARLPKISRLNVRRNTRREALGRAVPSNAQIIDGIDPPVSDNVDPALSGEGPSSRDNMEIDPRFETADNGGHIAGGSGDDGVGGLDQFMNLDGMETAENVPAYGQDFSAPESGGPTRYY